MLPPVQKMIPMEPGHTAVPPKPALCYDFDTVSRFFRSCALAIVTQRNVQLVWKEYNDSTVLNVVYALMPWKGKPGHVEVEMASYQKILNETDQQHKECIRIWIDKLHRGGHVEADAYIKLYEKLRDNSRQAINETFATARQINDEVTGKINEGIRTLAKVKLGAAIGVAVISGGAGLALAGTATASTAVVSVGGATMTMGGGGLAFTGVGLANSLALSMVKNWEDGPRARAVAVDMGRPVVSAVAGESAGLINGHAIKEIATSDEVIQSAQREITRKSRMIANAAKKGRTAKRVRRLTNAVNAQKGIQQTAQAAKNSASTRAMISGGAAKTLPIVFALWDIVDALGEYDDTVSQLR